MTVEQNQQEELPTTNNNRKKMLALISVLIIVLAGLGWYFLYFIKTPVYSLNIVREAIAKHDVNKFNKHVDVDNILANSICSSTVIVFPSITILSFIPLFIFSVIVFIFVVFITNPL